MNKPTIVFAPGMGALTDMYRPLLRHFRDYQVVGADPAEEPPQTVDWPYVEQPITKAIGDTPSVVLIGHSLGGAAVLKYAATHPDRVTNTIALAPVLFPFERAPARIDEQKANVVAALLSGHPRRFLNNFRTSKRRLGEGRMDRILRWARTIDLASDLPKLQDATIISPDKDRAKLREHFHRIEREFPNIRTVSVPGRHNYPVLKPKRFAAAIRKELGG